MHQARRAWQEVRREPATAETGRLVLGTRRWSPQYDIDDRWCPHYHAGGFRPGKLGDDLRRSQGQ